MGFDDWRAGLAGLARLQDVDPRWLERAFVAEWSPEQTAAEINAGRYREFPLLATPRRIHREKMRFVGKALVIGGSFVAVASLATLIIVEVDLWHRAAHRTVWDMPSLVNMPAANYMTSATHYALDILSGLVAIGFGYWLQIASERS